MSKVNPRTLSGFMELLPEDQMKMERLMQTLRETYSLFAFTPLDTPVIESAEVLLAKGGGETEKQIYRFTKGDSDLALRFDLTVPLAKYVAAHYGELAFPFKRYQIGKVYRGERAQRGRFREFYQADIDVIGDGKLDIMNEAEIPAIIYTTFRKLGLSHFKIKVNNRKILNGFYAMNGMAEKAPDIMRIVDKLFDGIGCHSSTPDYCLIRIHKESDRQHLHSILLNRLNERASVFFHGERTTIFCVEHLRHRWTMDICIQQSYTIACLRERYCQIRRNG